MTHHWLRLLGIGLTASLTLATAAAYADTVPSKPIRLIVPFLASGATDLLARAIAQKVGANMGQQIVVDNRLRRRRRDRLRYGRQGHARRLHAADRHHQHALDRALHQFASRCTTPRPTSRR